MQGLSRRRFAMATATMALALTGVVASAAQAAYFNPINTQITQTGSITLKQGPNAGPASTFVCPNWKFVGSTGSNGSNLNGGDQVQQCTRVSNGQAGTFTTWPWEFPQLDASGTSVRFMPIWGRYWQTITGPYSQLTPHFDVPFINGSGSTPSRLVYNNVHIGSGIFMSGQLDVKTTTGGLVTIVP